MERSPKSLATGLQVSEDIVPICKLKAHLSEMSREQRGRRRPLVVTRNGKAVAVMLSPEDFDRLTTEARSSRPSKTGSTISTPVESSATKSWAVVSTRAWGNLDSVVGYRVYACRMDTPTLSIGQVAKEAGIGVETVRFYEREGLLPAPQRRPSGYRQYPSDTARRIRFVQAAKGLGFTLKEIRELLSLRVTAGKSCADVRDLTHQKLAKVDAKLVELQRVRAALARLANTCIGTGPTSECPLLDALDSEGDAHGEG